MLASHNITLLSSLDLLMLIVTSFCLLFVQCNKKQLKEYPNIRNYLRELYQIPEIQSTVHMDHIKNHYYCSHKTLNCFRYQIYITK